MSSDLDRILLELELHRNSGVKFLPRRKSRSHSAASSEGREPPGNAAAVAGAGALESDRPPVPDRSEQAPAERRSALDTVAAEVLACSRCKLCEHRTRAVPGEGCLDPPILFIGEGPGADEDRSGHPFVGLAGQLLTKMIAAIGLNRDQVYITNIVKCRPPGNRTPEIDEVRACLPYLERQIELLAPRLICTLGLPATRALIPTVRTISAVRGREMTFRGIPLVPTFHPAYLLRNPAAKRPAWTDLQLVAKLALGGEARPTGERHA